MHWRCNVYKRTSMYNTGVEIILGSDVCTTDYSLCFRNLQKICWWETEKLPWTNFLTLVFLSLPNIAAAASQVSYENEPLQNTELQLFWGLKIRAKGRPHQWTAEKKVPSVPPPSVLLYSSQLVRFLSCWAILWSFQALHFKELLGCVKEGKIVKGEQQGKAQ